MPASPHKTNIGTLIGLSRNGAKYFTSAHMFPFKNSVMARRNPGFSSEAA
jgi:hypothetical protein